MKKLYLAALCLLLMLAAWQITCAESFDWDAETSTTLAFSGDTAVINGTGASLEGNVVTIDAAGTYVLSGEWADGQVRIAATKNDEVRLVLAGVSLTSSTSAPIYASKAGAVILILADGTTNTVTDASSYVYEADEDEPDAAIFSKNDLTIGGSGSLMVMGNYRNGIGTKDDLRIEGGVISVSAVNDGLRGRDSVTIVDGTIVIDAGNDGIKSNSDTDAEKGWIVIEGGALDISSAFDGIQAETALTIEGGTLHILAGGGAASAPQRSNQETPGMWGRGNMAATQTQEEEDTGSYKGLKAGTSLDILGGAVIIDAADDALHSNGDLTIHGGELSVTTGDDGAHADGNLAVHGGKIVIPASYEGLEGATVTISDGDIHITAGDDGINAAGGSDGQDGMGGGDTFRRGGSDAYWIEISGGTVWIDASGDGIDSNGKLTIRGGTVTVYGPLSGANGALDADGEILINGGEIMAASGAGMDGIPGNASAQPTLMIYFTQTQEAGTVLSLYDGQDTLLYSITLEKAAGLVTLSHPALQSGTAYRLVTAGANGQEAIAEVVLESTLTAISEDGSAVNGGGFGGRGGFGSGFGGGARQQAPGGDSSRQQMTSPEGVSPLEDVPAEEYRLPENAQGQSRG